MRNPKRQFIINLFIEALAVTALIVAIVKKSRSNIIVTAVFCAIYLAMLLWQYRGLKNKKDK